MTSNWTASDVVTVASGLAAALSVFLAGMAGAIVVVIKAWRGDFSADQSGAAADAMAAAQSAKAIAKAANTRLDAAGAPSAASVTAQPPKS